MNVTLTPEVEEMLQAKVQSGRYNSVEDVIRKALCLLDEYENLRSLELEELRDRIDDGLAALDRGEGVDGDTFMQAMLDELDFREARQKTG